MNRRFNDRLKAVEGRRASENTTPQVYPSTEAARAAGARGAVLIVPDPGVFAALARGEWGGDKSKGQDES